MAQQTAPQSTQSPEQQWINACNQQGWSDGTQVLHLEGFIRDKGLFADFAAYAAKAAAQENAEAEEGDLVTFDDAIDGIKEALLGGDAAFLAQTHNALCTDPVSYEGDSLFKQSLDGEVVTFARVLESIEEVLMGADGESLAQTYNRICSDEIEYLGDSLFKKTTTSDATE